MTLTLSSQEMLRIWEVGLGQHPIHQALLILAVAFPEVPRDELARLSIGQRDRYLLSVRAATFGARFAALASCPQCREQVECALDMAALGVVSGITAEGLPAQSEVPALSHPLQLMRVDGYEVQFRVPDSHDLAAIANAQDVGDARNRLVRCCFMQTSCDGRPIAVDALPVSVIEQVTAQMVECDPLAEVQLELCCPACRHSWQSVFDITTFLWHEISTEAKRLLRQVHTLALAYGWREVDILSMSAARRQMYIEMVT
jgi:hypothetical protein